MFLVSETRDICLALLINGYLPDWAPMQAKTKQGYPIFSHHTRTDTLAQGASAPLLYCPRMAVGAKGTQLDARPYGGPKAPGSNTD